MAAIGSFKKNADGSYSGSVRTLTLDLRSATFRPVDKSDEKAPDFRIFLGQVEVGAAWRRTSRDQNPYLSVKLDDPSFPAPVFASLVDADDGYSLIWSRPRTGE